MSTQNYRSIEEEFTSDVVMIPLSCVNRLNWDKELGQRLQALRGKVSRNELASILKAKGIQFSPRSIETLEQGRTPSISADLAVAITSALGVSLGQLFPLLKLEKYK